MAAIADKFGKASISTGYATATTVKVARTAGESVLSTYDLSKFAPDTPVFFVTYKKTTDPTTNVVSITSQTSWKALVNPDNNTLTNLTLAPGYTDIGNDIGDFVECIPTSFWGNSLVEGLFVSMNPDGTLKTSAVNTALGITGVTPPDWNVLPVIPTMVSSDGQRQHKLRYTGVDYRPSINEGFKLRIPRTGTTPTTSMAFVSASSQYASKTSPTGITFTDDFTVEAQVYPESYISQIIVGRMNAAATSGWNLQITQEGRIQIVGVGTSGVSRLAISYQSVPLNKWTHVAATLDMSAGTATIYIDGVSVPLSVTGTGTSLIQAGDLSVGRYDGGAYFNGKIANARVWSTIRTAAEIRDNMNKENPASTTGLVAHFKGNGSWNDSSSNANHLTAFGGAVNNSATHPYNATEYAIATKVEYTGGNTDVTVFTGSNCLPNEALGATSYSGLRAPYGFPADSSKWKVTLVNLAGYTAANSSATIYLNIAFTVPTGSWKLGYNLNITQTLSANGLMNSTYGLGASAGASVDDKSPLTSSGTLVNAVEYYPTLLKSAPVTLSTPTTYYLNARAIGTNFTAQGLRGLYNEIYAECPYL